MARQEDYKQRRQSKCGSFSKKKDSNEFLAYGKTAFESFGYSKATNANAASRTFSPVRRSSRTVLNGLFKSSAGRVSSS